MSTNKNQRILTGYIHRLEDGVLKTYAPGDVAPDWVTNPKVLAEATPASEPSDPPHGTPPAGDAGKSTDKTDDDLTGLSGKQLADIAGGLGLKKNGSKAELTARIREKRAESATDPAGDGGSGDDEDARRAALIEKLKSQGHDVDDSLTEAELQALTEEE